MAKSPIVLPLSTTFLQRFSQHFSTDGGRNPIGRRTETDWTADANGGTLRGCTCLKCTNRARNAPTEQELHPLQAPSVVTFSHRTHRTHRIYC